MKVQFGNTELDSKKCEHQVQRAMYYGFACAVGVLLNTNGVSTPGAVVTV